MKFIWILAMSFVGLVGCEQLTEEDTPVCKDCYSVIEDKSTGAEIEKSEIKRLCGGDIIAWENLLEESTDTTVTNFHCD